jgi:gluconolactonase
METLAFGYGLAEAPRADSAGNLYFSDAVRGGVYRWAPDGTIVTVVPKRRGVGGLVLHADGGVVVSGKNVCHVRNGETRVLLTVPGVVGFNDLITDAAGRVFVGSLRSSAFEDAEPRVRGELWRIDRADDAVQVYGDVAFANGVGFSPDGRTIYHSNYSEREVLAHDLRPDGSAFNRRVFARLARGHPDGLAVDDAGSVWVALGDAGGIGRFAPDGTLAEVLDVPAGFVASLCFGGADRRDLYVVTADNQEDPARGGTVFRTRVEVPGLVAALARV